MAITGAKFLELNDRRTIIVTTHALDRINEHSGISLDIDNAVKIFRKATYLKHEDLLLLGYRPATGTRKEAKGEQSWYFYTKWQNDEMIIVVSKPEHADVLIWVTTYFKNDQTRHYRVFDYDEISK